jgi:hypothetical protein
MSLAVAKEQILVVEVDLSYSCSLRLYCKIDRHHLHVATGNRGTRFRVRLRRQRATQIYTIIYYLVVVL